MILSYTPLARQDLHEIEDYIKNELANPQAAKNTVQRVLKGCSNLKANPKLGLDLALKIGQKTDLRYLIISNHIAVYRIEKNTIKVIRIRDGRTDYINYLFSEI